MRQALILMRCGFTGVGVSVLVAACGLVLIVAGTVAFIACALWWSFSIPARVTG